MIDFGMSCINPGMESIAWQAQQWFYPILDETRNARCDNPSLDVCCIITSLALYKGDSSPFGRFLNKNIEEIKQAAKKRLVKLKNCQTAQEMLNDNSDFTRIRTRGWQMGNKGDSNTNYWVYELGQVDLIRWYPEHMLSRILPYVPLDEWKIVRAGFGDVFDTIAPKVRIRLPDGREGILQTIIDSSQVMVILDGGTRSRVRLSSIEVIH
jgi:hypothetical protein